MEYIKEMKLTSFLYMVFFFVNCRFVSLFLSISASCICMWVPHISCQLNLSVCTWQFCWLCVPDIFCQLNLSVCTWQFLTAASVCTWQFSPAADCVYLTFFASWICLLFVPDNFCQLLTVSLLEGVPAQLGIILASGPRWGRQTYSQLRSGQCISLGLSNEGTRIGGTAR